MPAASLNLTKRRICVTGGGGFLGSFLVEALRERGCTDIFVPRKSDYDLTTADGVDRMFRDARPQVLFHLAAVVGGIGANLETPGSFFYQNAIMGIQVIEKAHQAGVEKTIVTGTVCAYPKSANIPFREEELWDGYPEETNAPYGIAKRALLVQCQAYRQQYGMNAIYLLPVNLYGPRDNFDVKSSHVIAALIRKAVAARDQGRPHFTCWGDGSATREFLFVRDAAEALVLAAEHYNGPGPVNIGSSQERSIKEVASSIGRVVGFRGAIQWDPSKPNGQLRRKLDTSRALELFGFSAKTDFEAGLKETVAWYEANAAAAEARNDAGRAQGSGAGDPVPGSMQEFSS